MIDYTLIEGIQFLFAGTNIATAVNVTSIDPAPVIASDLFGNDTEILADTKGALSLQVGNKMIIENSFGTQWNSFSNPGSFQVIPEVFNEGQQASIRIDIPTGVVERWNYVLLREGFQCNDYSFKNFRKQTVISEPSLTDVEIRGTIEPGRGRCVGFEILNPGQKFNKQLDLGRSLVNLNIGGVTIVKNAPGNLYATGSTRPYRRIFTPLNAGDDFLFRVDNPAGIRLQPVLMFYFDE